MVVLGFGFKLNIGDDEDLASRRLDSLREIIEGREFALELSQLPTCCGVDKELSVKKLKHYHLHYLIEVPDFKKGCTYYKNKKDNARLNLGYDCKAYCSKHSLETDKDRREWLAYAAKEKLEFLHNFDEQILQPYMERAADTKRNELKKREWDEEQRLKLLSQKNQVIDFIKTSQCGYAMRDVYISIIAYGKSQDPPKWIRDSDMKEIYQTYLLQSDLSNDEIVRLRFGNI